MKLILIREAQKALKKKFKQYEREAYQAYESASGKNWKERKMVP